MIKIGSRRSDLAKWQAELVAKNLKEIGHETQLIFFTSEGDEMQDVPLPVIGGRGVFTKALDDALLENKIDLAVHSMKDIPTELPDGICIASVLERDASEDVLVCKSEDTISQLEISTATIATSSNRRKAQWLDRYPSHTIVDIRGNIQTRLRKLQESDWDGAIFAKAGLLRLAIKVQESSQLDWMIPAPAQGVIAVSARVKDEINREILNLINHPETELCTTIERGFLHALNGGCSAPIGALATIEGDRMLFEGIAMNSIGTKKLIVSKDEAKNDCEDLGKKAAMELLSKGADELITQSKDK